MEFKNALKDIENLADQIVELVGEDFDGAVGLRGIYNTDNLDNLENSFRWDDGVKTDEELDGVSVLKISGDWRYDPYDVIIDNLKRYGNLVFQYGDNQVGLVIGQYSNCGEDIGEILIKKGSVIYTWDK